MMHSTPEQTAREAMDSGPDGPARLRCRKCGEPELARVHLPGYLRPLRAIGIDLRKYVCYACEHTTIRRSKHRH